jgi:hypothetical protein
MLPALQWKRRRHHLQASPGLMLLRNPPGLTCLNNLLQIGGRPGHGRSSMVNNSLSFQLFTNQLNSPALLFCPADVNIAPTNWDNVDWARIDYQWLPQTNR